MIDVSCVYDTKIEAVRKPLSRAVSGYSTVWQLHIGRTERDGVLPYNYNIARKGRGGVWTTLFVNSN